MSPPKRPTSGPKKLVSRAKAVLKKGPRQADGPETARRIRSIPPEVVLAPQAEAPRQLLAGQDRSGNRNKVKELSWMEFDREIQGLARRIAKRFSPEAVVGVAHGGVFVGGAVASALGCEFFPVRISRRSRDTQKRKSPRIFGELPRELKGRKVLIVDDVASSGDTLELACQLARKVGCREVQTAVLVQREGGFAPDHAGFITEGLVVFPWDYAEVAEDARFDVDPDKAGA